MTYECKLEAVSKDIRTKLPELMEVSRGCNLLYCGFKGEIIDVAYQPQIVGNNYFLYKIVYQDGEDKYYLDYKKGQLKKSCKTLGHDIQLHHVLKWLGRDIRVDSEGLFYFIHHLEECEEEYTEFLGIKWNLDKTLKDQSKELIDYLYSLIK